MESDTIEDVLDLSRQNINKLNKAHENQVEIKTLILDENQLQKLDNIESFLKVQKLSIAKNNLIRMYGIGRLHNLSSLNLSHNSIITIEGLKELVCLKNLNLSANKIKTIEHLNTNVNLEHLDLSENVIAHISDISFLKNLKELLLHGNRIGHLRQCERYLPSSLELLTLASNNIVDLNEISQLVHLTNLNNFSITGNPCVCPTSSKTGFAYRPFLINWLMNLKVIDGYIVDPIESLQAEWLYSQGRGRHFRVGDHQELIQYLSTIYPPSSETLQTEENRKLRLILSKAQQHQQQLREQLSANGSQPCSPNPSPSSKRKTTPKNSPRIGVANRHKPKSPDRMATSCFVPDNTEAHHEGGGVMSKSLDASHFNSKAHHKGDSCNEAQLYATSPLQAATKLVPVPESLMSPDYRPPNPIPAARSSIPHRSTPLPGSPRQTPASTSNIPKKESIRGSPKFVRTPNLSPRQSRINRPNVTSSPLKNRRLQNAQQADTTFNSNGNYSFYSAQSNMSTPQTNTPRNSITQSSDEESEMSESKLKTIRNLAQERQGVKSQNNQVVRKLSEHDAAVKIQTLWRGYSTRNLQKSSTTVLESIRDLRTHEHIKKLADDMEKTKEALECERKIQMLQMQAINALWQKVSAMQAGGKDDPSCPRVGDNPTLPTFPNNDIMILTETCNILSTQVQQLQESMGDIVKYITKLPNVTNSTNDGISTQTEIIAVRTPQGDAAKLFPFQKSPPRPSSLPLFGAAQAQTQTVPTTNDASTGVENFVGSMVNNAIRTMSDSAFEADSLEDIKKNEKCALELHEGNFA